MRVDIVETNVYKFDELTDEGKEKAIAGLYDLNVDHEWWDCTYEDAETVGIKITGFTLLVNCDGSIIGTAEETSMLILENHGKDCETFKTATKYLEDYLKVEEEFTDLNFYTEIAALDEEFEKSILEDYRIMLDNEHLYLTSDEAITETIKANDYEFTAEGVMY
jgi:hypothetical protein